MRRQPFGFFSCLLNQNQPLLVLQIVIAKRRKQLLCYWVFGIALGDGEAITNYLWMLRHLKFSTKAKPSTRINIR
jgi:hypothetical protein